jgi:nitroimidazol reductase NimA-like FMN-containing flavoprotein (pyridoxamine 5'-phosphate oxidase superfamily)
MKPASSRATVKRLPKRGNYESAVIHAILDEGLLCHVGFVFNHSMNYRSAVVFGRATAIVDPAEKRRALDRIVEHVAPGRAAEARAANDRELGATTVLAMPLDEASAKIRTGGVVDDEEDYALAVWAGVLPLRIVADRPIPDERLAESISVPESIRDYRRPAPAQS